MMWGRHALRMDMEDGDASRVSGRESGCCVIDTKNFACDIFGSLHFAIDDIQIARVAYMIPLSKSLKVQILSLKPAGASKADTHLADPRGPKNADIGFIGGF